MDALKNAVGMGEDKPSEGTEQQSSSSSDNNKSSGGVLSGISDKLNSAAGGGRASEKNEDMLDKGMYCTSCFPVKLRETTSLLTISRSKQESTSSKKKSSARVLKTTSPPSNKPRTSRFPSFSGGNIRALRVVTCLARTSERYLG